MYSTSARTSGRSVVATIAFPPVTSDGSSSGPIRGNGNASASSEPTERGKTTGANDASLCSQHPGGSSKRGTGASNQARRVITSEPPFT